MAANFDRTTIRYLDGTTTADPVPARRRSHAPSRAARSRRGERQLEVLRPEPIPTGRILAALSTALDLTEGQLAGHSLRTCYLAMRLADPLGLDELERATLFHAAL